MNSSVSIAWGGLLLLAFLVIGGLAVLFTLIAYKKTRPLGLALGGAILIGLPVLVFMLALVRYSSFSSSVRGGAIEAQMQATAELEKTRAAHAAASHGALKGPALIPLDEEDLPADDSLPEWAKQKKQGRVGDIYRQVLEVGPYSTQDECERALEEKLVWAARTYASRELGLGLSEEDFRAAGLTGQSMRQELGTSTFSQTYDSKSLGQPMTRMFVQVEFNDALRKKLRKAHQATHRNRTAHRVGALGGLLLTLVGVAFGVMKTDDATAGRYRKRLFLGVPAAIIGVVAVLAAVNS